MTSAELASLHFLSLISCPPPIELTFPNTMSDPIPSATGDPDQVDQPLPANAEDRKAAAALSALNTNEVATDAVPAKGPPNADQEALGKAMSRLEIAAGQGIGKKQASEPQKEAEVKKRAVKVAAADVTLLVCLQLRRVFPGLFPDWCVSIGGSA